MRRPELPAAGTGPQTARPAAERATGREAARSAALDLDAGTVRVRAAFVERSTGELVLGQPKSKAGRRTVGIPQARVPRNSAG